MQKPIKTSRRWFMGGAAVFLSSFMSSLGTPAQARVTAFMQAVAESAARDKAVAAFYQANGYRAIWTGNGGRDRARRQALLKALSAAPDHGLPRSAYDTELLRANLRAVKSERDMGRIEVQLSQLFLAYAADMQSGILTPSRVDKGIARKPPVRNRLTLLTNFSKS